MFPELPKDLSELTDEHLATLADQFKTIARKIHQNDEDTIGDRDAAQVIEEMTAGVLALEQIKDEQKTREQADENYVSVVDELAARAGLEAETPEEPAAELENATEEPEEEPETEAAAEETPAAAAASARFVRRPLPTNRRHQPAAVASIDERGLRSRINSEEVGVHYGDPLDRRAVGELLNHIVRKRRPSPGDTMIVASATFPYGDERILGNDGERNMDRISALVDDPTSLVASGALCAPLEPIYDLPGVETAERPVRAALTSFQANRGGVIVGETPTMTTYEDAVGTVSAADNETGGSLAVKNCLRIECRDFNSVQVDSIYTCIEADNLAMRSYPEFMARIDALVRAEQARFADGFLLSGLKVGSTAVTGDSAGNGGATWHLLGDIFKSAARYRSNNRMAAGATLNALFPAWVIDGLALDVQRAAGYQIPLDRNAVEAWLRAKGINPTFYLDTSDDASPSQVLARQTAGAIVDFPATVEWFLFAPGTWLHLDAGTLDLGVVRDSSLNSTNDFQVFAETWEQVAFVGVESQVITSSFVPNGTFSAGQDLHATS